MTNRYFDEWLSKFRPSISTYDYYVDFEKVYRNVDEVKIELNLLNSLIGSKDIKTDFVNLLKRYPEILKAIPILLAKRENEIYCQDENGGFLYKFDYGKYPPNNHRYYEMYTYFMEKSGLFDLLQNHIIKDLVDYVTGVETGLDSNGRKNRGGHLMENLVEKYIQEAGFVRDVNYFKEMYLVDIEKKWKIDLSALSNDGKAAKRFDFVVKTSKMIYAVETNFYTGGGSKLNETARSYKMLSQEANTIDSYDMSVGEIISLYKDGDLKLNPAYQRLFRWDEDHKTNFVESILIGIPIPEIFVAQKEDGKWDIVDGVQRISTLLQLVGELPDRKPLVLHGTGYLPSLEGMTWETMPSDAKRLLKRARIGVNIILTENSIQSQYDLFQRLNTGGVSLESQEIRNCLIIMLNETYYNKINELKTYENFLRCLTLTDSGK